MKALVLLGVVYGGLAQPLSMEHLGGVTWANLDASNGVRCVLDATTNLGDTWTPALAVTATSPRVEWCVGVDNAMAPHQFFRLSKDHVFFTPYDFGVAEMFPEFTVYTPYQGTVHEQLYIHLEEFGEQRVFNHTERVPEHGTYGTYNTSYDPARWPNARLIISDSYRFEVSFTPDAGQDIPAGSSLSGVFRKVGHRRKPLFVGLTFQQGGLISQVGQEALDGWMHLYQEVNGQVARQLDLDGVDSSVVSSLQTVSDWAKLKDLVLTNGTADYLHLFSDGSSVSLGSPGQGGVTLVELQGSPYMATNGPLKYVALDGHRTGKHVAFLKAWVGYGEEVPKLVFIDRGLIPRYGWCWGDDKAAMYEPQGAVHDAHFMALEEFYSFLVERDLDGSGRMVHSYREAWAWAGRAELPSAVSDEVDGLVTVGCAECYFNQ